MSGDFFHFIVVNNEIDNKTINIKLLIHNNYTTLILNNR